MNIKSKGWNGAAGPGGEVVEKEIPETPSETEAPETLAALEAEIDKDAEEGLGEEMSEAYADLLRRAMEDTAEEKTERVVGADETAGPATEAARVSASHAGEEAGRVSLMLRCGHVGAHVLALAVVFWVSFSASASLGTYSDHVSFATQLSTANSYLSGYASVVTLLGVPTVLMAASLAGRGAMPSRLALAAAAADLLLAAAMASVAAAFAFPAPAFAGVVFAALGVCAAVSVWKA